MKNLSLLIISIILTFSFIAEGKNLHKNSWLITAYCSCVKCCGKNSDGITASGFPLNTETKIAANNFLPFGTRVQIAEQGEYIIRDRGSIKYFGRLRDKVKHIDIYIPDHSKARAFGVQYKKVEVLK